VAYGLPGTFLADAEAAVDRLERAVRGQATGKTSQSAAQAGIDAAIASGLEAARTLDVIVANQFRGDPMTRAAWTLGRRSAPARRVRRGAAAAKPGSSDTTLKIASGRCTNGSSAGSRAVSLASAVDSVDLMRFAAVRSPDS